eukprot:257574-Ditylum_brightwellii.AAC.1
MVSAPSTVPPPCWEDLVHSCSVKYFTVKYNNEGETLPLLPVPVNWDLLNLTAPPAPSAPSNPPLPTPNSREKGTASAIPDEESGASTEGDNGIAEETTAPKGATQMEEAVPSEGAQHTEGTQAPSSPPSSTPSSTPPSLPQVRQQSHSPAETA